MSLFILVYVVVLYVIFFVYHIMEHVQYRNLPYAEIQLTFFLAIIEVLQIDYLGNILGKYDARCNCAYNRQI